MNAAGEQDSRSTQQLVAQLSEDTSRLVRGEIRLAVAELQEKRKHAGLGLGLFSGAGLLAFFGLATLITASVLALELVLPAWAAALIVAGVLFAIAGVAALVGRSEVHQAAPPPERTVESVKQDVEELTSRTRRATDEAEQR